MLRSIEIIEQLYDFEVIVNLLCHIRFYFDYTWLAGECSSSRVWTPAISVNPTVGKLFSVELSPAGYP